jgi:predicted permease
MKNQTLFLSKLIMVEQRYLAVKDTPKFQRNVNSQNKQGYFTRNILMTYVANAFLFTMIFVLLNSVYFEEDEPSMLASFGLIVFIYLFIIGIYNSIVFLNSVYNNNIMSPLKSMPIKVNVNVPFVSWFLYNSSSYIFVVFPSAIFFYLLTHNYETILLTVIYAFFVLMLSFIISSIIFIYSSKKAKTHTSIKNVVKILALFLFLGAFYLLLEEPSYFKYISSAVASLPFYVRIFAFPINLEYIIYFNSELPLFYRILEVLLSLLFLAIVIFIYLGIRYKIYNILMSSEENASSERISSQLKQSTMLVAFLKKDAKSTFRKPQNLSYIFLPVLFVIPFFIGISSGLNSGLNQAMFSLLYLVEFVSSFYSIFLLVVEGKGIEVLNSLPVKKQSIAFYKSIFGLIIFSIIALAFIIATTIIGHKFLYIYIFDFFDAITLFYVIIMVNINRLLKKLPPGTSNLNYYSFGTYPLLFIFIISIIILGISVLIGLAISFFLLHTLNYYAYFDLPVNAIMILFLFTKPKILKNNENVINSL